MSFLKTIDPLGQGTAYINFSSSRRIMTPDGKPRGFIDSNGNAVDSISRISLSDSILRFFPSLSVFVPDPTGYILDKYNFIEGEEFDFYVGSASNGLELGSQYCWSEFQINDSVRGKTPAGMNAYILIHKLSFNDIPKTRCFKNMTISDIIYEIALFDFQIDYEDVYVTPTTGLVTEYQINETNSQFIQRLASIAYSSVFPTDPFFTFINSTGEFFFMCANELLNTSSNKLDYVKLSKLQNTITPTNDVGTYYFNFSPGMQTNRQSILGYTIAFSGHKPDYKKQIVFNKFDATTVTSEETLMQHSGIRGNKLNTPLIKKSYLEDIQSYNYIGIADEILDKNFIEGYKNNLYQSSWFSYRFTITIHFNPLAVAGRLISLDMDSVFKGKGKLTEFCGTWLILNSEFMQLTTPSLQQYQVLTVCKPGLDVDPSHPFISDFARPITI